MSGIRYTAWAYKPAKRLKGFDRHARDKRVLTGIIKAECGAAAR